MPYQSLAARYRPQTFAEVAGQEPITRALSRVCAEGAPAPAYLLSGTRGVGKTTIARIFAKALNCQNGPAAEPCNQCAQCRHVTEGNHVDVCEIDAASNTGVDDVRALRENLGFMPMEGKFKIFIVDEAHMLSKSAFNALLKTLEEPPGHTVFIFATTESHRFPATIVSRCQHYIFRHLPEDMLFRHLASVLEKEGADFEKEAVRLIARRALGSVRDSLSLLDQTLCLGEGKLTAASARQSLGLAGPEFFDQTFSALASGHMERLIQLCGQLLEAGTDIGFFLRELIASLRNLFLLAQSGEAILPALMLPQSEAELVKKHAANFSPSHLHAAWQMALQSQRSILQSPQPAAGLELLMLNLAMLPKLVPLERMPAKSAAQKSETSEAPSLVREDAASYGTEEPVADWEAFCNFCRKCPADEAPPQDILRLIQADWQNNKLRLSVASESLWERLRKNRRLLDNALRTYCGENAPALELARPGPKKNHQEMLRDCANNPQVRLCQEIMGASIADCYEKGENHAQHERHPAPGAGHAEQAGQAAAGTGGQNL